MPSRTRLLALLSLLPGLAALWTPTPSSAQTAAETFQPTWDTRRLARTYVLGIPAPRGQITDRNGEVLAQVRVSYNLGVAFPYPQELSDAAAVRYAREQIALAERLTGRKIAVKDESIIRHYQNRGILPYDIAYDLSAKEQEKIRAEGGKGLALSPIYLRHYPNGPVAAHIIGYAGRANPPLETPLQNYDLLWPEAEGREGLELTFNAQLTGKPGELTIIYNEKGEKVSERVSTPPQPGYNVITTLDLRLQKLAEKALADGARRGAVVIIDPRDGSILALASYPSFDPNFFIPAIASEDYKKLDEDPAMPMIPRAFRSAYPPGSSFKPFTALAAIESGRIPVDQQFAGPNTFSIGNIVMRNSGKLSSGMIDVSRALEESNNVWFYQMGIRARGAALVEWTTRLGFGRKTRIPLRAEAPGNIPDDEYMMKVHKRRLLDGDLANFSIGQGDILTSPLQIAQAMGILANQGVFYQTRLVQQVQTIDDRIIAGYDVRIVDELPISDKTMAAIRKGMVNATNGGRGTGRRAAVPNVEMAGKTGTAQWGPVSNKKYAAWYAGFVPAEEPEYAFAVLYEGNPNEQAYGGRVAAPIAGQIFKEVFKDRKKKKKSKDADKEKEKKQDEEEEARQPDPEESSNEEPLD